MYTQNIPLYTPRNSPVYLNDNGQAQQVDSTSYLLNLVGKILKGDSIGQATQNTFEDVCKDGIKQRINANKGKIFLGVGLFFVASATAGYQMKKHNVLKFS